MTSRKAGASRPGGRGRGTPVPVRRTFPWGAALGGGALVLLAVLGYAVTNAGSSAPSPLRDADKAVAGVSVASTALGRNHQGGPLSYDRSPSWGGDHNPVWQTCTGAVYPEPIPQENATHSLEHGAVWVTYRPDLPSDQVAELRQLVDGQPYRLLSPYPGLPTPVSVQAWGRQLTTTSTSDPRITAFLDTYTQGPQTPEQGATCSSGNTTTGTSPPASS